MLTVLWWNLNGRPLANHVARLCRRHQVDVLAVAELAQSPESLTAACAAAGYEGMQFRASDVPEAPDVRLLPAGRR